MEIQVYRNKKNLWPFILTLSLLFVISGWTFSGSAANIVTFAASALIFNFLIILLLIFFNSLLIKKLFVQKYQSPFSRNRYLLVAGIGTLASVGIVLLIYAAVFSFINLSTEYGDTAEIKLPAILVFIILFYGFTAWQIKNLSP